MLSVNWLHLIIWLHHELGILSFPFREPISSFVIQPLNQNVCLRLPSCKIHVSVCCQFLEVQKLGKNHYPNFIEIINKLSRSYYCCYWIQWKYTSKIFWITHCWQKARKFLGQKEKLCNYFDVNFDKKKALQAYFLFQQTNHFLYTTAFNWQVQFCSHFCE